MLTLTDTISELNNNKNDLLASMISLKFEYIDLEKINTSLKEENQLLKEKVNQLETSNLSLKTEFLELSVIGKGKGKVNDDQTSHEEHLNRIKSELFREKENSWRLNL